MELAAPQRPAIELLPFTASARTGERQTLPRLIGSECAAQSCTYAFAGRSASEQELRYRFQGKDASKTLRFPASDKEFSTIQLRIP